MKNLLGRKEILLIYNYVSMSRLRTWEKQMRKNGLVHMHGDNIFSGLIVILCNVICHVYMCICCTCGSFVHGNRVKLCCFIHTLCCTMCINMCCAMCSGQVGMGPSRPMCFYV